MRLSEIIRLTILLFGCNQKSDREAAATNETATKETEKTMEEPKRVTGIGGIFFKSKDPEKMRQWYGKHLGLEINEYGSLFEFRSTDEPEEERLFAMESLLREYKVL